MGLIDVFTLSTAAGCFAPSASFDEMKDLILDDNNDDSKKCEGASLGNMEATSKFDNMEVCIRHDREFAIENEKEVQ